jgi:O-acetylhomoserine/O-acetylserine sulfhydrylase-like pyridoxal-dependent enzyme
VSTLPRYGITTTLVDSDDVSNFEKAINDKTKALFIETIGNPITNIIDIEAVAKMPTSMEFRCVRQYLRHAVSYRPIEYAPISWCIRLPNSSAVTEPPSAAFCGRRQI